MASGPLRAEKWSETKGLDEQQTLLGWPRCQLASCCVSCASSLTQGRQKRLLPSKCPAWPYVYPPTDKIDYPEQRWIHITACNHFNDIVWFTRTSTMHTMQYPFIHYLTMLILAGSQGGPMPISSCSRARGKLHYGQVACPSKGDTERDGTDNYTHTVTLKEEETRETQRMHKENMQSPCRKTPGRDSNSGLSCCMSTVLPLCSPLNETYSS